MNNNEIQEIRYQVGEAWKGTYNAATPYGNANVVQDPTGLSVYRSLKPGNVGHPLTDTAWWFLIIDLSSIKEESDRIKALNDAIAADEAQRVENENGRVTAEQVRVDAENARVTAEQERVAAEQQRVSAEQQRASQEQTRISQEQSRVTAEQGRVAAEAQRVQKEQLRENNEAQRVINETNRVSAEAERVAQYAADHQQAVADHDQYVDFLGVFDLSKHNAVGGVLATYADLSAALTALNALDSKYKYGGMSFKFVHDNKYVQCRLIADEFTTDTTQWAIADEGVYVENPEFIYVKTDAEDRILFGIKKDGGIYYGVGVPQQVKDYIKEKIADLSLDEYEDIVAFLNDLEKGDKTLQELLNEKVDKIEGKSLSTNDYTDYEKEITNSFSLVENPEYLNVETDAEDRILGGRKADGTKFENMPVETPSVVKNSENNPEYNEVHTDKDGRILYGVKPDGEFFWAKGIMASDKEKKYIIDAISNYPSVKYLPLMQSLKRTVIKTEEGTGKGQPDKSYKTLSLATLTDIHAGTANLLRFIEFISKYRDYIDDSIILGDIAGSDWPHYDTTWDDIAGYQRILKVIGNHDIYHYNDGTEDATEAQCYGRYMQGISQWGVNYTADKCYYYKDYVDANIRLIVLDCEHITTEQTEWLQNVLNGDGNAESALALGRHVVIAQHRPVGDKSKITLVECNFTTKNIDPKVQTTGYAAVNEAVKDFQDAGGTFVMYMAGHWHWDIIANYDGYYPNQTLVVYPNGKFDGYWRDTVHTEDTPFFDQFTITSIDTKMKYIRLLRIGATFDRHLIHRESIVISYAYNDRKIISQY